MTQYLVYIDEEPRAQSLYSRRLQKAVGDGVAVKALEPERELDAMVSKIENFDDGELVSIVIDQKLDAAGTATYYGTDLVAQLRLLDHLIPIYILTNFVDDVNQNLGGVEYVLNKDDLQYEERLAVIGERVLRHVNVFQKILSERESRFEELLRKRFEAGLTADESAEYVNLKYHRERKSLASTFIEADELTQQIELAEAKLQEIESMLNPPTFKM